MQISLPAKPAEDEEQILPSRALPSLKSPGADLVRARLRALPATMLSLVAWLVAAFGLLTIVGGQS